MANFTYKNITITGADSLSEAKEQAAIAYLQQFGEPTQQEIDDLLVEIEAEELERLDFEDLEADIANELAWIEATLPEIDNGIAAVGAFTNATQRAIITGLLQNQRRILLQQRRELKAWRFVIRRLE
jgi:hypothetical protein